MPRQGTEKTASYEAVFSFRRVFPGCCLLCALLQERDELLHFLCQRAVPVHNNDILTLDRRSVTDTFHQTVAVLQERMGGAGPDIASLHVCQNVHQRAALIHENDVFLFLIQTEAVILVVGKGIHGHFIVPARGWSREKSTT